MRPVAFTTLLGASLLLTAALFDAEPLYVPALVLVTLVVAAVAWVTGATRGAAIRRTLGARRVVEDEPVGVRIEVRSGKLGLPSATVTDPLLPEPAPLGIGRTRAAVRIQARFRRRGLRQLPPPVLTVSDPLGLATRVVAGTDADELLVLPRIEPVAATAAGGDGPEIGATRSLAAAAAVELDGLRPHMPGSPASRIYWPSVARGGTLMERRMRPDADARPLVVLDPSAPATEEDLDAAVRAAASLCVHLARRGGCALLLPGDRRASGLDPTLRGWPPLHARLALVGAGARPALGAATQRHATLIYVSARARAHLPRALAHAAGRAVLVVPTLLAGYRPLFAVAGLRGYDLRRASVNGSAAADRTARVSGSAAGDRAAEVA